jgi:hypothetical protein
MATLSAISSLRVRAGEVAAAAACCVAAASALMGYRTVWASLS